MGRKTITLQQGYPVYVCWNCKSRVNGNKIAHIPPSSDTTDASEKDFKPKCPQCSSGTLDHIAYEYYVLDEKYDSRY